MIYKGFKIRKDNMTRDYDVYQGGKQLYNCGEDLLTVKSFPKLKDAKAFVDIYISDGVNERYRFLSSVESSDLRLQKEKEWRRNGGNKFRVIDAGKLRDIFYYGKNDEAIISPEIDAKILEILDECTVELTEEEAWNGRFKGFVLIKGWSEKR